MEEFRVEERIMEFLDELCDSEECTKIVYKGIGFEASEVRELINKKTELGRGLYKSVEMLYYGRTGDLEPR